MVNIQKAIFFLAVIVITAIPALAETAEIVSVEPVVLLGETQLRELVAPVALYSDELLAIVLPASTYPLQIVAAARYREAAVTDSSLEPDEVWDESVVALLNYPEALDFLNADLDWTWELGQAVAVQQEEVLAAVSAFREEAHAAGNLDSDEHQVVAVEDDVVTIRSSDPEVVYVPYYEPREVTLYQTERVYHYYPSAYPVYYYPYDYGHHFYDYGFWGISSVFLLSWDSFHLRHYTRDYHYHPYYGRTYHYNHFRRTHRYNSPRAHHRRTRHVRNNHHGYRDHWRPNHRYAGARPHYRDYQHDKRKRHTRRNSHREYSRAARSEQSTGTAAARRESDRQSSSSRQPHTRSAVQRPRRDTTPGLVNHLQKNRLQPSVEPTPRKKESRHKVRTERPTHRQREVRSQREVQPVAVAQPQRVVRSEHKAERQPRRIAQSTKTRNPRPQERVQKPPARQSGHVRHADRNSRQTRRQHTVRKEPPHRDIDRSRQIRRQEEYSSR